LELFRY